ncbi:MAG: thiamine-phosphate kinase [Promethearchaeota archaeon]
MKVKELGEKELIKRINRIAKVERNNKLAIFDDAFYSENKVFDGLVFTTDMLVGKTDVPDIMEPYHVGRKSVIMNISDLVVKGVRPTGMVVSFGLPGDFNVSDFENIIKGIWDSAKDYQISYLGGDINEADDLIISIFMFGFDEGYLVPRSGMEPGQLLCVTGEFGYTTAGLYLILNGLIDSYPEKYQVCVDSVLKPRYPYNSILKVVRQDGIIASIDSSDGLSASLLDLMEINEIGFLIDKIPINPIIGDFANDYQVPIESLLFYGGEEYHAVMAIEPDFWDELKAFAERSGIYLEMIGRVTEEQDLIYQNNDGIYKKISKRGYEHFNRNRL